MKEKLWLIGAGPMGLEYAKVLQAIEKKFIVIGRGEKSAEEFKLKTGHDIVQGGISFFLRSCPEPAKFAIVAVSVADLFDATFRLAESGVRNILVEKPAALSLGELIELQKIASAKGAEIFIAYNRRFLPSVKKCIEMIDHDGGLTSFHFEFTELGHKIETLSHPSSVKKHWFLANSTHVTDLAFHIGGMPVQINCLVAGGLNWHPSGSFFAGTGITEKNVPFDYRADWKAPGRWSAEFFTEKNRFLLQPLETLKVQKKGSFQFDSIEIDDETDKKFKPGLHAQVLEFLSSERKTLHRLDNQIKLMEFYLKMANYA